MNKKTKDDMYPYVGIWGDIDHLKQLVGNCREDHEFFEQLHEQLRARQGERKRRLDDMDETLQRMELGLVAAGVPRPQYSRP